MTYYSTRQPSSKERSPGLGRNTPLRAINSQPTTPQDAAVLNIQRACEAAIDMGQHVVRRDRLGVPQGTREIFSLLLQANRIDPGLAETLQRMVGFRNIAVHQYQALQLPILIRVLETHLDDFMAFSRRMLR